MMQVLVLYWLLLYHHQNKETKCLCTIQAKRYCIKKHGIWSTGSVSMIEYIQQLVDISQKFGLLVEGASDFNDMTVLL
jgi:hypothetical protein